MNESTTTTTKPALDRADLLAWLDARLGGAVEQGVIPAVARAIRRNKIQQIGSNVIDARLTLDAARAAQALE